ncbi:MAG TPA: PQQ-binding-like beta-propeller repeat protein, partial [Phycisphaerae bacterium]|nr:PQQ-binding-like beta-propeller repeat protein [Phycisphaerae bacterium]
EAVAAGDLRTLRRIPYGYLHTRYGAKALDMLGAMAFDRGRFARAARCWNQALRLRSKELNEALLLAKLGAAQHLAGEASRAKETAEILGSKYPDAAWTLGGRRQKLVEFLARVRKMPVDSSAPGRHHPERWWGLGGYADGMGLMSDVDVVLAPRWHHPSGAGSRTEVKLVAMREAARGQPSNRLQVVLSLKEGHVEIKNIQAGNYYSGRAMPARMVLPPLVHPVVSGDVVIYRTDDTVVGCDLVTGEQIWGTVPLPMNRKITLPSNYRSYYYNPYGNRVDDAGRHTLTVGGGMVYTVANFRPSLPPYFFNRPGNQAKTDELADTSELVALSLDRQLLLVWRVGNGQGDDETVRNAKFLSAPTYHDGRLYVLAVYLENFHLICLDAPTGSLVWKTMVCQAPVIDQRYGTTAGHIYKGSPPAVSDGRVFCATNSGVIAALDADGGQAIWAFQYETPLNQVLSTGRYRPQTSRGYPANPVVVSGGRVLCLPADSEFLWALSTEDGALMWKEPAPRDALNDLTAVDAGRVAMSGPGLCIVSMADGGKTSVGQVDRIVGRPAVTPTSIMASGRGRLWRVSLDDYSVSYKGLSGMEENLGLLGNLVSVKDELIAANASGICAYMNYDQAWAKLTDRMKQAEPNRALDLLLSRGRFAFNARRFAQALSDLEAAWTKSGRMGRNDVRLRAEPWLCRTHIALGNASEDPNGMLASFQKAMDFAKSAQEKVHMNLRLAKCHRMRASDLGRLAAERQQAGDANSAELLRAEKLVELKTAAAIAQEISEKFADEDVADIQIGKEADDLVLLDPRTEYLRGKQLAQAFVRDLIRENGREVYAQFDAMAQSALNDSRQRGDEQAMAEVGRRWPNSIWADMATLMAAELLYRKSAGEKGEAAEATASRALRLLAPLASESADRQTRMTANVGMAAIYARSGRRGSADYSAHKARELATDSEGNFLGETAISFGDLEGSLAEILNRLGASHAPSLPKRLRYVSAIEMPLGQIFGFKDDAWSVVRDHQYQPVRVGERILMLQGDRAVMVDTSARDANKAVDWQALTAVDPEAFQRTRSLMPGMSLVAGLSKDEQVLAVADLSTVRGFDLRTAKAKWSKSTTDLAVPGVHSVAVGEGVLVFFGSAGKLVCVDVATGKVLWTNSLVSADKRPSAPPQILGSRLLVSSNRSRQVTCFDMAAEGRVIGTWSGSRRAEGVFADNGMLVLLVDGQLKVYDPAQLTGTPLWSRKYEATQYPTILAVSNDHIAVLPSRSKQVLEVLSMIGGDQIAMSLSLPDMNGHKTFPAYARFEGQNLYVVGSAYNAGLVSSYGQTLYWRGVSLHRVDLREKRRVWSCELSKDLQLLFMVAPLTVGRDHLAMTLRTASNGWPMSAVHIIDARTGKKVAKVGLAGKLEAWDSNRSRRMLSIGPAVMTNGRLCVETLEGVVIYGS